MKTPNTLDLTQDIELQFVPDFQSSVFTVTGEADAVLPIADEIKALEAAPIARTHNVAPTAGKAVVETVRSSGEHLLGRVATDIKTVAYDRIHGTSFYDALQQKRADERNLKFAVGIGLISLHDVTCRKHQDAIAKMRGL